MINTWWATCQHMVCRNTDRCRYADAVGPRRQPGIRRARQMPTATVVTTTEGVTYTKTTHPSRHCPWRIGGPQSLRFASNGHVDDRIDEGARVREPAGRTPPTQ
jgi:hypothetical protein